mmetsp:Transcript_8261/g.19568  ORF Transcript_8261/g.19568 Transcript_8261/m.19568 type:complete len:811 (+) Transcript_8261:1051-3483(+)
MGLSQRVALLLPRRAARLERRDRELAVHLLEHLLLGHALGVHAVRVRGRVRGLVGRALPKIVALVEVDHVDDLQHHVGARLEAERAAALLRDQVLALVLAGLLSELLLVEHRTLELREELVHHRLEARLDRVVEEGPLVVLAEEQPVGELGEAGVVVGVDHARAARAHGLLDRLHVGARARDAVHLLALLERQVEELAHLVEQRALLEGHDLAAARAGRELVLVELGRHLLVDLGWDLQLRHERLVRLLGVLAKVVRRDALGEAGAEHGAADLVVDRDGLLRGHAQELAHNGHGILVVVIRALVERVGEEEAVGGGEVGLFHGLKVEPTLEGVARRGVLRERAGSNELVEEDLGGLLGVHHILQAGHGTLGVVEAHETDRLLERLVDHILNKREDDRASGLRRHGKLLLTGHQRADGAVERIGIIVDRLEDLVDGIAVDRHDDLVRHEAAVLLRDRQHLAQLGEAGHAGCVERGRGGRHDNAFGLVGESLRVQLDDLIVRDAERAASFDEGVGGERLEALAHHAQRLGVEWLGEVEAAVLELALVEAEQLAAARHSVLVPLLGIHLGEHTRGEVDALVDRHALDRVRVLQVLGRGPHDRGAEDGFDRLVEGVAQLLGGEAQGVLERLELLELGRLELGVLEHGEDELLVDVNHHLLELLVRHSVHLLHVLDLRRRDRGVVGLEQVGEGEHGGLLALDHELTPSGGGGDRRHVAAHARDGGGRDRGRRKDEARGTADYGGAGDHGVEEAARNRRRNGGEDLGGALGVLLDLSEAILARRAHKHAHRSLGVPRGGEHVAEPTRMARDKRRPA